jgi:hypothetical protein
MSQEMEDVSFTPQGDLDEADADEDEDVEMDFGDETGSEDTSNTEEIEEDIDVEDAAEGTWEDADDDDEEEEDILVENEDVDEDEQGEIEDNEGEDDEDAWDVSKGSYTDLSRLMLFDLKGEPGLVDGVAQVGLAGWCLMRFP